MSEKSFAVASVSVAVIWGTFFYPPSPHASKQQAPQSAFSQEDSSDALRADKGNLRSAAPALLKTAGTAPPVAASKNACAFPGSGGAAICAPLQKLAGN